ncbi:unnamed protein product [Schistosoma mattheei]|uniref:Uncharacterized protein n=1 Tax=Schistosoma mattheei TaxID=31246 RepID=A0A183NX60_9TREM|nr:unnamed protein product [Schistosoma mattheei]
MLSKEARKAPIGWESHGYRIIKGFFKTKKEGITRSGIQRFVPTSDKSGDDKDQSHVKLHLIVDKCSGNDLNILMEDVADVASDHHLVFAKMKRMLKKHWITREQALQKLDTAAL